MTVQNETKVAVTVAEMARMVGLSRSRFYQLIGTAFPQPERQETGRPLYTEALQNACLEVRRRNCGIDGKPVLFYSRRLTSAPTKPKPPKPKLEPKGKDVSALMEGLNSLGLTTATAAQIQRVTEELFPDGTEGRDQGEVLRAVFLHLKRRNHGDNMRVDNNGKVH
jgi:hypothetical protein